MMVVGITGGIGSGKSTVCEIFRLFGVPVYEADSEAKKLYELPEVIAEVRKKFGSGFFTNSGELDKKKFAELVFNDDDALKKINVIIHPYVKKKFSEWKKGYRQKPYVLKEAAILFESGSNKGCDRIITVSAPVELRLQRVVHRDGRSRDQVQKIMDSQWSDAEKASRADFVIFNDESRLVLPQVLKIHELLLNETPVLAAKNA